ncbi:MAG: hypothetical protein ABFR50_10755 [Candidatus Fermentibacteria bacterium]
MLSIMICTILMTPSTPEAFMHELCGNSCGMEGAEFWSSHASSEVHSALADPDSLSIILGKMQELTVDPGARTAFETYDSTFRIEFGESIWTWTDSNGGLNRIEGLTTVVCSRGIYSWSEIPALLTGSVNIGRKERLISGILITFLMLISAFVFLIWAKRRYL